MKRLLSILLMFAWAQAAQAVINDPIAWWKFDETGGTNAANSGSLGASADGTYTNSPTLGVTGAFGSSKAAGFVTTSSQYVACVHDASLNSLPLTVTCWVKTTSTRTLNPIVNKYVSGSLNGWFLYLNNGKPIAWYYLPGGSTSNTTSTASTNDGTWHHWAVVFTSSATAIYIDGTLSSSVGWSGTPGATTTTQPVNVARYATGTDYGDATIDDVRIYNRALNSGEVSELYAYTGATPIPIIMHHLRQQSRLELPRQWQAYSRPFCESFFALVP